MTIVIAVICRRTCRKTDPQKPPNSSDYNRHVPEFESAENAYLEETRRPPRVAPRMRPNAVNITRSTVPSFYPPHHSSAAATTVVERDTELLAAVANRNNAINELTRG